MKTKSLRDVHDSPKGLGMAPYEYDNENGRVMESGIVGDASARTCSQAVGSFNRGQLAVLIEIQRISIQGRVTTVIGVGDRRAVNTDSAADSTYKLLKMVRMVARYT